MTLLFLGYALPGTVMFLFGLGWCWGHAGLGARVHLDRYRTKTRVGLRCCCPCSRGWRHCWHGHPVQGLLKLLVSLVGMVGSLFAAYPDGSFQYVGDVPFATVYFFFALSGCVDVLSGYWPRIVSHGHAAAALSLAFLIEAVLLNHADGGERGEGGRLALRLMVAVMATCAASTALCALCGQGGLRGPEHLADGADEARQAVDAVRCVAAVVHGTWLYHCSLLLYWPPASRDDGQEPSAWWVTLCFAWHCAAAAVLLLVLLVARRGICPPTPRRQPCSSPTVATSSPSFGLGPHRGFGGFGPGSMPSPPRGFNPHHSCLLCDVPAASPTVSYHRSGSLV